MGSKTKSSSSKRTPSTNELQDHSSKRSKKSQHEISSSISLSDHDVNAEKRASPGAMDLDAEAGSVHTEVQVEEDEDDNNDMDMQDDDRESSDQESDVEDDEDQELKASAATVPKREAHTSDRVKKTLTNPEIEAAFHDKYMTKITLAFGDELNTLRETDSLEGVQLELLIDSLNQTGHVYSAVEKALWVAEDGQ